jgi:hypothetical protein
MNLPNSKGQWAAGRDALVDAFMAASEGEVLTFDALATISGYPNGEVLRGMIQNALKICEKKHGVVMRSVPGTGYERAPNLGRAAKAVSFGKSVFRKIKRTVQIGQTVEPEQLPPEQRASFAARMAALGGARAFMSPQKIAAETRKSQNGTVVAGDIGKAFGKGTE